MSLQVQDLKEKIRDGLKSYTGAHGVVHVRDNTVVVDNTLRFTDNEVAVVFLNNGDYFVVIAGTPDGDFIIASGSAERVRKKMLKIRKLAQKAIKNPTFSHYGEFYNFVADVFFSVLEALTNP